MWAHRWLAAKTLKEETTIKIAGIGMSVAFNRRHFLDIVKSIIDEDDYRLMQCLLSVAVIDKRVN